MKSGFFEFCKSNGRNQRKGIERKILDLSLGYGGKMVIF
jgi:hypothetical protein